jgi:hypothetical protein
VFFSKNIKNKNVCKPKKRREKNGQHQKERINTTFSYFSTELVEVLDLASKNGCFSTFFLNRKKP